MLKPNRDIPSKKCLHCDEEMIEMADSYTDHCPECSFEQQGVLVNAEGLWVWQ